MDEQEVRIAAESVALAGTLTLPANPIGIVLFAHGSGSSRHSPRNRFVAATLQQARLATLLMALLTREEEAVDERTGQLRFDVPLLADRLGAASKWVVSHPAASTLRQGYFGASTGAGAALMAAAAEPDTVAAVVSRGGRPDLAGDALPNVRAPALLIVGGNDPQVLTLNRQAMARMQADTRLEVVPGATHLFEEPGALDAVATMARDWLVRYLSPSTNRT